jgi:hypothetical protein
MIGRGLAVLYNLEVMFDELYASVKLQRVPKSQPKWAAAINSHEENETGKIEIWQRQSSANPSDSILDDPRFTRHVALMLVGKKKLSANSVTRQRRSPRVSGRHFLSY